MFHLAISAYNLRLNVLAMLCLNAMFVLDLSDNVYALFLNLLNVLSAKLKLPDANATDLNQFQYVLFAINHNLNANVYNLIQDLLV